MSEMWSWKERWESKITPRLRAWETGLSVVSEETVRVGLFILASWAGRPNSKNSVLVGFSERKLDAIHAEMLDMVCSRSLMFWSNSFAQNDMKSWVSSAYNLWLTGLWEIMELRGVVYKMKRSGPRTEPWGTPYRSWVWEEIVLLMLIEKEREDK